MDLDDKGTYSKISQPFRIKLAD